MPTKQTTELTNAAHEALLWRVMDKAELGRLDRAKDRPCTAKFDGRSWAAEIRGKDLLIWRPRITVVGERSFGCNCPDHKRTQGKKGPCKHVLSLATAAMGELDLLNQFTQHAG